MSTELRKSGIDALGDVPWGTHLCHFYETPQDLLDTLVPFFAAGLAAGELCLWMISDPLTEKQAEVALRAAVPELDRRLADRSIELLPNDRFGIDVLVRVGAERVDEALARGYAGVRVAGRSAWLQGQDGKTFREYEREVDRRIAGQRLIAMGAYPLVATGAAQILDAARTHKAAVVMRQGIREVVETPEFRHAQLEDLRARRVGEERFRRYFELGLIGMVITSPTRGFIEVNDRTCEILGFSRRELLQKNWTELTHADDLAADVAHFNRVLAGEIDGYSLDKRFIRRDGQVIHTTISVKCIRKADGSVDSFLGLLQDITERKLLEQQLYHAQKMEAVGQLAGGIAHDFNNLIMAINGYSALVLQQLPAEDPLGRTIEQTMRAAERAAALTRRLLAFGRKQLLQPEILDLNSIVSEMEGMLRKLIGEGVELRVLLGPELGGIRADPGQIEQVIMNLVVNARDAMPGGGSLTLSTEKVHVDEASAKQRIGVSPGSYVMLTVADTGTGMDEETRRRIFEPFFTTKERGKGTGLGLSTVYGIVKQSGGDIQVHSHVGRGTTFNVCLPHLDTSLSPQKSSAPPEEFFQGTETILLVEDEELVRRLVRELLEVRGYRVLEAEDGNAALEVCERYRETIPLVLTDVSMPGMSGPELAGRLAELRPEMKVLYMTGYADESLLEHLTVDSDVSLEKPFTPGALARKVRQLLDAT